METPSAYDDFYESAARRILAQLAITDTAVTSASIRIAIAKDYKGSLSYAEISGIIAAALTVSIRLGNPE